jgi:hypothetical protein
MSAKDAELLEAPYVLEYTYRRSLGEVLSQFFTGLRDGRIMGAKTSKGEVLVPPCEYDPATGEAVSEVVAVGDAGVVTTWAWVEEPRPKHPMDKPFAWALIKLDGADSAMLHAVDAGSMSAMATGMRVAARWRQERVGSIHDIACFEPEGVGR